MAKKRGHRGQKAGGPIGSREDRESVQATFLEAFAKAGTIRAAAEVANVSRRTHYDWLKNFAGYRRAFAVAEEDAADTLEEEARSRAVEGVEEPVGWYKGEPGGHVTRYSDGLLKFLLEGRRASVFKRRHELTGADGGPLTITQIKRVIVDPAAEAKKE